VYNSTGYYDVSLTVTNAEGCTATLDTANFIFMEEGPIAEFTFTPSISSIENPEVEFTNESSFANSYQWDFGYSVANSFEENPTHVFPMIGNMAYTVTLTATNSSGCVDVVQHVIHVEDVIIFYVPNVFTPDGDRFNQTFKPIFTSGYDIYDFHFIIFDRWGEIIFESFNAEFGWDGTYGDNGLVEDGVYVWQVDFGDTNTDKRHVKRGHIVVLK